MLQTSMIRSRNNTYLIDINLDDFCKNYSKLSDLLENLCSLLEVSLLEWHQYIDHGIGRIAFQNEIIKVIWEEFPNSLSFELHSLDNANLILRKINLATKQL